MKTIEKTCPVCQTAYMADPSRLKHGRQTTCSKECSYKLRSEAIRKTVTINCCVCHTPFEAPPSRINKKIHENFCSKKCHYQGRSLGFTKRVITKPYQYSVEGKAALISAAKKPKGKRVFHIITCANCNKKFDDPSTGRKRKGDASFCSLECCNHYRTGSNNPAWRGGYKSYYGKDWRCLRRKARIRDKYTCQRCNKDCSAPKRLPDVHHIKPVSSFLVANDANTLENLVCLCHSCHMHVEWNGIDFIT